MIGTAPDPRLAAEPVANAVRFLSSGGGELVKPDPALLPAEPLVSCLCVTENRWAFLPWVLWNYDRQSWSRRELVIVDSSDPPLDVPVRDDVRVIRAPLGSSIGAKRNLALRAANGDVFAWFDDDDWQHPRRLAWLVPLLCAEAGRLGASYLGPSLSFFVDLWGRGCRRYHRPCHAIFNGSVFVTHAVANESFPENVLKTEDTLWLCRLERAHLGACLVGQPPPVSLWLSHDANTSNRRARHRLSESLDELERSIGPDWGDTNEQMQALRERLRAGGSALPARSAWIETALRAQEQARLEQVVKPRDSKPSDEGRPEPPPSSTAQVVVGAVEPADGPIPETHVGAAPREAGGDRHASRAHSPELVAAGATTGSACVPRVRVYWVAKRGAPPSTDSAFVRMGTDPARCGCADAAIAAVRRRRREWRDADYVGVFDARAWAASGLTLRRLEALLGNEPDVWAIGTPGPQTIERFMSRVHPSGRHVVQRLFRDLRLPHRILTRPIPTLGCRLWLARPAVFERYVEEWLVPTRPALEALAGDVPDDVRSALVQCLAAGFFSHRACRTGVIDVTSS